MNILITGANRGIGLELTRGYLVRGDRVFATSRKPNSSDKLIALQKEFPGHLEILSLDVSNEKSIKSLKDALSEVQTIDLLINNAGSFPKSDSDYDKVTGSEILETFQANALGPFLVTRTLMPWLELSKRPMVASISSLMGSIEDNKGGVYYAYRMSKAALNMFNKSLSVDFPEIISVVLHPGWVKTDMGGPQAPTLPEVSSAGLIDTLSHLTQKSSGRFYDFQGKELPW